MIFVMDLQKGQSIFDPRAAGNFTEKGSTIFLRIVLIFIVAVFQCACASSRTPRTGDNPWIPIQVADYGIYRHKTGWPVLKEQTDRIPVIPGTRFGIRINTNRLMAGRYRMEWTFPEVLDPETGKTLTKDSHWHNYYARRKYYETWVFNRNLDEQPGRWTFRLYAGDRIYIEQHFDVYAVGDEPQ